MPAALTLRAASAPPATWGWFGAGALLYASGHGIHLAANSIGNRPHPAAYVLALGVGLTWASNAIGADLAVGGLVFSVGLAALGWQRRAGLGLVLLVGFAAAAVVLGVAIVSGG